MRAAVQGDTFTYDLPGQNTDIRGIIRFVPSYLPFHRNKPLIYIHLPNFERDFYTTGRDWLITQRKHICFFCSGLHRARKTRPLLYIMLLYTSPIVGGELTFSSTTYVGLILRLSDDHSTLTHSGKSHGRWCAI
jgi:hypothetical protein